MRTRFLPLLALLAVAGCDTTEPEATGQVFVANQGVFSDQSGAVTQYEPASGTAATGVVADFEALLQNVEVLGDRLFVFLNFSDSFSTGSGRIAVADVTTGALVGEVEVGTPRQWAVAGDVAFVTNFYGASVTPVALGTLVAGPPIPVGDNPEGIVVVSDRIYVANYSAGFDFGAGTTLSVVSDAARAVVQTVDVGCDGPRFLSVDAQNEVWVVCTGRTLYDDAFNVVGQTDGAVVVLEGETGAEVARFALGGQVGSGTLGTDVAVSDLRDEVYVSLGDALAVFDTAANARAGTLAVGGAPISAVAFDDVDDKLYLGRLPADPAVAFSAPGAVTVHERDGTLVGRFDAGVLPTDVAFGPAR